LQASIEKTKKPQGKAKAKPAKVATPATKEKAAAPTTLAKKTKTVRKKA
jgi:hypothetical protein